MKRANAANDREDGTIELEGNQTGGLRLYCAWGTDIFRGDVPVIIDVLSFGFVYRVVDWARAISAQAAFVGNWRFGVAVTRIAGARSLSVAQQAFMSVAPKSTMTNTRPGPR